ncbi:iron dicitrate transport regulator FecR [Massilia arenosa]|uniref:Iron dicitrate transport regulator FecR n=1 Tax=Zemynaea arenosa TaxID=2561931 RepID=A0A4Y9S8M6_9BURK|nr:FecR domain-containing protein [Massilia arenosa]TFW18095.1 iron dicitrate transport regulator FecR [Massilia arenosa]
MFKAVFLCALLLGGSVAWAAQVAGTVVQLSGPLVARKPDGKIKVLAQKSEVESGDTLVTEKNTFAMIRFIDNSEITLRPATTFTIENFAFESDKPENDSAAYNLVKGGLRSVTGALGKRNKEKFAMKTPAATIGIRGTTFIIQYVPPTGAGGLPVVGVGQLNGLPQGGTGEKLPADPLGGKGKTPVTPGMGALPPEIGAVNPAPPGGTAPTAPPPLAPGLHLSVTDGAIVVTNNGGSLGFQAGQFGYVPSVSQPPIIVPSNPNIQFVPPPSFNSGSGGPTASNGPGQGQAVDCIVR